MAPEMVSSIYCFYIETVALALASIDKCHLKRRKK